LTVTLSDTLLMHQRCSNDRPPLHRLSVSCVARMAPPVMSDLATCSDCGASFYRDPDESWKVRCLACWVARKGRTAPAAQPAADPIRDELAANLRALLGLCHPDKHGGSPLATKITQWLLSVRERVSERVS